MSPRVRLEPLGEELDCAAHETVLDAAFRQGYNLAYGCREGQCSACKCYLLAGAVALKPYSNFALSDTERSNGYTLMCRAMPEQDLTIELLHHDPDNYRLENAIADGVATVQSLTALTHDIAGLTLRVDQPQGFSFLPGQYIDLHVPGAENARRSFSIANLPAESAPPALELMIKRYPGGRLSGMLGDQIAPGTQLAFTGPYGAFHLRPSPRPIVMIAGGSGMAPILGVLRQLAAEGCKRPVRFFYGARARRDLFALAEIEALGARLADFRFAAVLSDTEGFVHESVDAYLDQGELTEPDVYMCGPPPMLEAAEQMLIGRGIDLQRIFQDKFTTAAQAQPAVDRKGDGGGEEDRDRRRSGDGRRNGDGDGDGDGDRSPADSRSEREFAWLLPHARRATLYEDVTVDTQPSIHRHLRRGWPVSFEDGRGTWNDASTALECGDWFAFRDPGEQWERPFYEAGSAAERQLDAALRTAAGQGLLADLSPAWVQFLQGYLQVPAFVEHGLWFALATAARDCLSDTVATCVCLQAAMKQRSAQAIVLYAMDLEQHLGVPFETDVARESFLREEAWQPTRRYVERLAATADWGEVLIAANLCFEPTVATLLRRELGTRAAAANGDTVTPVLARVATQEWEWARVWTVALHRMLLDDPDHGAANRELIGGWVRDWLPQAVAAALALTTLPQALESGIDVERASENVRAGAGQMLVEAELPELCELVGLAPPAGHAPPADPADPAPATRPRSQAPPRVSGRPASARQAESPPSQDGSYDFVGIVMARSAEGDAVARLLARRPGIEVIEQPSFWDIRARDRLVIAYSQLSEELGYEIDAYSIQHEMSTHYGRMVATDDSLMLFSDPTEAMEHLLS